MDLKKHKDLWRDVVFGDPSKSLSAASTLNKLGEMSDKTFQVIILSHIAKDGKGWCSK